MTTKDVTPVSLTCQVETLVTMVYHDGMNSEVLEELIEYKFAPGPLLAVQGFANTHSYENDEELLRDPDASRRWLVEAGLIEASAEISAKDQEELLELRVAVRALLNANHDDSVDTEAVETLRRLAAEHPVKFEVKPTGGVALNLEPAASAGDLIAQTIGIISQAQERDEWRRLKICPASDCRWAFYDSSKNRGGTWCRMEVCGNRNKNRKYRQAQTSSK